MLGKIVVTEESEVIDVVDCRGEEVEDVSCPDDDTLMKEYQAYRDYQFYSNHDDTRYMY